MDGDARFNSYKQYKAGTVQIVQWLVEKSKYQREAASPYTPTGSRTKRVGNGAAITKIYIPTTLLPELARSITKCRPLIDVPSQILLVLRRVIAARKEFAWQYQRKENGMTPYVTDSDRGHLHFIRVLEEVLGVLQSMVRPWENKTKISATTTSDKDDLKDITNPFEHLDLEEPSPWLMDAEKPVLDADQKSLEPETTFEMETPKEDAAVECLFARFCLFQDFQHIRQYIQGLWEDYRDRKTSLVTAALTTNIAFHTIHRLHTDFAYTFPEYRSYASIDDVVLSGLYAERLAGQELLPSDVRSTQTSAEKSHHEASTHIDDDDESPLPGCEVYNLLEYLSDSYKLYSFEDFDPSLNHFDWSGERAISPPKNSQDEVENILLRAVPDCLVIMRSIGGAGTPADQLSCDLFEFNKTQQPDLITSLCVECEIFADIHFILLKDLNRGFQELSTAGNNGFSGLRQHEIHMKAMGVDRTVPVTRQHLAVLRDFVKTVIQTDLIAENRQKHFGHQPGEVAPFCLFKHHPVLCGALKFHLDRSLYYCGLRVTNEWAVLICVAHLYKATRQTGYLESEWVDMETLIDLYTPTRIFVGEAPCKFEEMEKRLLLGVGVSVTSFARDSRKARARRVEGNMIEYRLPYSSDKRLLDTNTPILDILRQRYRISGGKDTELTMRELDLIISKSPNKNGQSIADHSRDRLVEQWNKQHKLTPIQFLSLLRQGISGEEFQLHFDYLAMNRRCMEFLRRLRARLRDELPHYLWDDYSQENENLHQVVGIIFNIVSNYDEENLVGGCSTKPLSHKQAKKESPCLRKVGQYMGELIKREGNKETNKARQQCV